LELLFIDSGLVVDREIAALASCGGVLTVDPQRLRMLRTLVTRLAEAGDAEGLATSSAAGAAEGELLSAITLTLDTRARTLPSQPGPGRPALSRQHVLERTLELIAASR